VHYYTTKTSIFVLKQWFIFFERTLINPDQKQKRPNQGAFCITVIKLRKNLVIARSAATRQSLKGVRSLQEIATAFGLAMTGGFLYYLDACALPFLQWQWFI